MGRRSPENHVTTVPPKQTLRRRVEKVGKFILEGGVIAVVAVTGLLGLARPQEASATGLPPWYQKYSQNALGFGESKYGPDPFYSQYPCSAGTINIESNDGVFIVAGKSPTHAYSRLIHGQTYPPCR